jgi:hypothetical protein
MTSCRMKSVVLLASCGGLVACGGGGGTREEPVNTDYSALRVAPSHEGALSYATSDEQTAWMKRIVKYDGSYIYTTRPQIVSEFTVPGAQTGLPHLYQLQSEQGSAEFLAAISQDYRGWLGGLSGGTPQLDFKGVIKTAKPDGSNPFPAPPYTVPRRAVMHDAAVFVIDGERFLGELWSGVVF